MSAMHTVTRARVACAHYCAVLQATIICVRITLVVAVAVLACSLGLKLTKVRFAVLHAAPAVCCPQQAAAHALCGINEAATCVHREHLQSAVQSKQQLTPCVVCVRQC